MEQQPSNSMLVLASHKKKPETCRVLPGVGCMVDNVVYRATITRTDTNHRETYTGSTYNPLKTRVTQHNSDINSQNEEDLKRQGIPHNIKWDVIKRAAPYNPITKMCRLCICEKFHILFHPEDSTPNKDLNFFSQDDPCP